MTSLRIGIPVLTRGDLLENCVSSIDYPVERLLIIANRWEDEYEESVAIALERIEQRPPPFVKSVEIERASGNLGVAGSFNLILTKLGPCIIASDDCVFMPGALDKCAHFISAHPEYALHRLWAMVAFHFSQELLDRVGFFDENLWPYGWDDIDLFYRLAKSGLRAGDLPNGSKLIRHDHPTQSIHSSTRRVKEWMNDMSGRNIKYGIRKWGIRKEHYGMLHKRNQWAIDVKVLTDAGNHWNLDMKERMRRIRELFDVTGIHTNLIYCKNANNIPATLD